MHLFAERRRRAFRTRLEMPFSEIRRGLPRSATHMDSGLASELPREQSIIYPRETTHKERCLRMRRTILLATSMALALLLACGVALAATVDCEGGTCVGTPSNDTLFGTPQVDEMFGLAKGDLMYGYESADLMSGGGGSDRMYGGVGADTVNGDAGNDAVYGGRGNDAVNGGDGEDLLVGDAGNDTISGDTGGDLIQAVDDQKDQINCAGGRDEVYFDRGLDELRRCEVSHPR